ncbi:hypothetical protein JOC78_002866 [Bacillus ectoiniformans]|uniref:group-specific protein n=1 Tax=Bacillus ectoiniformans TaxID=1494429 RepID=UPI001957D933|nr:group-specific protein [Bacillus ectoiniformans]MBM7649882.1 hypothetical protein [Bacillus ectoiniformans]
MGSCNLDHSLESVIQKLESQADYLPVKLYEELSLFLQKEHSQETLNELFHLLKKYDLSSEEEQLRRSQAMRELIK